jgi:hypothetical protein
MSDNSAATSGSAAGLRMRIALGEFAIIVFGVLAALAVNASWQEHVDRDREQHYLHQLAADLSENRRRLEEALALEQGQMQRASNILAALRSNTPLSKDAARALMLDEPPFPWFSDPRLLEGTLVALIETGDINLLRDDSLRIHAIRYQGQLRADLTEFGRKLDSFQSFESHLFQLLESARPASAQPEIDDTPGSLIALRNNPEATAVFRSFRMNTEARMWYLSQMLAATNGLLGRLQSGTTGAGS